MKEGTNPKLEAFQIIKIQGHVGDELLIHLRKLSSFKLELTTEQNPGAIGCLAHTYMAIKSSQPSTLNCA
jgi:hypothetical protein